jgi:DNA-binding NarL/FixJ family response regulator
MYTMNNTKLQRIAVLASCDLIRAGLRALLSEMGAEVLAAASAEALQPTLRLWTNIELLVADADQIAEAVELGEELRLPLLVVAPTVARGVAVAGHEQVKGVVTLPLAQGVLAEALASVVLGERYLSFELAPSLEGAELTEREQQLVALDLQDVPTEESARWMGVETGTTYTYRSRIRRKLRKLAPSERPEWVAAWLQRFPGQ